MPHTSSAKKRLRQNKKRRLKNRAVKKAIKTQIKEVLGLVDGPAEQMSEQVQIAVKKLDKAAAKRVIHPNTAARKKSQLARLFNRKMAAAK